MIAKASATPRFVGAPTSSWLLTAAVTRGEAAPVAGSSKTGAVRISRSSEPGKNHRCSVGRCRPARTKPTMRQIGLSCDDS